MAKGQLSQRRSRIPSRPDISSRDALETVGSGDQYLLYAAKSGGLTAGTAYSVSKSAMTGLTFSIARETAGQGVTSNAIAPACVMSPMVSEQLNDEQRAAQLAQSRSGDFANLKESPTPFHSSRHL